MTELFKILKRKTAKVEQVSADMLAYEERFPEFSKEIVSLVGMNQEIGIEIEVERVDNYSASLVQEYSVWSQREDHSLRDNGWEFVSLPIKGNRITFALNQFFATINSNCRFSPRTSIHIHCNVLDMSPEKIAVMLGAYSLTEELLYKFVGEERDKSNFAVPFKESDAYDFIEYFLDDRINFNLEANRYAGLNIDSIRKFGTLEFRHLGGTSDKVKIVKWINLIFCLKRYAQKTEWATMKYNIDRLNTVSSYALLVNEIYGECKGYLDQSKLLKDMERPAASLKKIKLDNAFLKQIKNEGAPIKHHWYMKLNEVKPKKNPNEYSFQRIVPAAPLRREVRRPQAERVRINEAVPAGIFFGQPPPADRDARARQAERMMDIMLDPDDPFRVGQ
jgi:hypothetical protein